MGEEPRADPELGRGIRDPLLPEQFRIPQEDLSIDE